MNNTLFTMNADNGITVLNIDAAFGGDPIMGKLAEKCQTVAPRSLHYLSGEESAVLVYRKPPKSFLDYNEELYGFRPVVLHPKRLPDDWRESGLSLLHATLSDDELIEQIRDLGRRYSWRITPFIHHPLVFELSDKTGLPVNGMSREAVTEGKVIAFNDKSSFQKACGDLGIPIPNSQHARGWQQITSYTRDVLSRHKAAMLRCSKSASGLGNLQVNRDQVKQTGIEQFLTAKIGKNQPSWEADTVLVEPVLDVACSPSMLVHIDDSGHPHVVLHSMQRFAADRTTFIGAQIPSGMPAAMIEEIRTHTLRYAWRIAGLGARGWCSLDWGVLCDDSLVAFESNFRWGGNNHALAIREKLEFKGFSISNDALHVSPSLKFETVWGALSHYGLGWNRNNSEGVVISIPPEDGSMGFVALSPDAVRAEELAEQFEETMKLL